MLVGAQLKQGGIEPQHMGLIWLSILNGHMCLRGVWLGVDLRTNNIQKKKKTQDYYYYSPNMCSKEIRLSAQNL